MKKELIQVGEIILRPLEVNIIKLAARGKYSKEIAKELGKSIRTIDNKLQSMYEKIGVEGKSGIGAWYVEHFDKEGNVRSIFGVIQPELLEDLNKNEQRDRLIALISQQLIDIREDCTYGVPKLALKRAIRSSRKLRISAEKVRETFGIIKAEPFYELLSRVLYEQVQAQSYFSTDDTKYKYEEQIANEIQSIAELTNHKLPNILAKLTKSYVFYLQENYEKAHNTISSAYNQINVLGPRLSHGKVQILRIMGISAAQLKDSPTVKQAVKKLNSFAEGDIDAYNLFNAIEGIARIRAITGSKKATGLTDEAAGIRDDNFPNQELMEIRTRFETMYYLEEPDVGYVEELKNRAIVLAGQNQRHREHVLKWSNCSGSEPMRQKRG